MAKVSLRAYNREIETMIDSGHLDEAIANCRHILKTFPKHLETYRLLGKAYLEYKRYSEAADIFSRVLAAVPDDFVANVGMSIIGDEENKLDDAVWHMERAFETQPSNAAIQSELQRLYGRRDGVQPPRIRMTRGALAHMYVQGELYPQAISEIKSVLKEDAGRVDMQALLARACYRSGLKNEAADVASSVLRTYSYCLEANRVLTEILVSDRSESAQVYRQRVVELDPYAAHVTGTVFQSNEAPEAAVNVERLDWNGQPVGLGPDWETTQSISPEEGGAREEQPEWLRSVFDEPPTQPPPQPLEPAQDRPAVIPPFETSPSPISAEPQEDIPDFLRAAGWGESTGEFDESKSPFVQEEPETESPIAKGELPDWIKAMAPVEAEQPSDEEEELPDWINQIGTGAKPSSPEADNQLDWIRQLDQPAQEQSSDEPPEKSAPPASDDQPDWLKGFGSETEAAPAAAPTEEPDLMRPFEQPVQAQSEAQPSDDQLDWLKELDQTEQPVTPASDEQADWVRQLDQPAQAQSEPQPSEDQPEWLKPLEQSGQPSPSASEDQPEWLKGFGSESESARPGDTDWLSQIGEQAEATLSESAQAESDLLAETEEREETASSVPASSELDFLDQTVEEPAAQVPESSEPGAPDEFAEERQEPVPSTPTSSTMDIDTLGTSEQERDDSFAWLENLAAKQGASEGLLTKPEDRPEEEPDWVKQAKGLDTDQAPAQPSPVSQPSESIEDLGKSEQERDDSFAWLENLAAKQGASEGLLTKPEERMEEEPDWIKQARDLGAVVEQPPESATQPVEEEPSSADDTATWLRKLDQEDSTFEKLSETDATGVWLKSLDEGPAEDQAGQPTGQSEAEIPEWLQAIEKEQPSEASAPSVPGEEAAAEVQPIQPAEEPEAKMPEWMQNIEREQQAEASAPPALGEEAAAEAQQLSEQPESEMPAWMQGVEEQEAPESEAIMPANDMTSAAPEIKTEEPAPVEDLPEWMQDIEEKETGEEAAPAASEQEMTVEAAEWMGSIDESVTPAQAHEAAAEKPAADDELPAWLSSLEEGEDEAPISIASDEGLPAWLRGEEEAAPETAEPEPTQATDWQPVEEKQAEPALPVAETVSETVEETQETPEPATASLEEPEAAPPVSEPEPEKEPAAPVEAAISDMPVDPILGRAREELSSGDIPGALNTYGRLIRKTRLLDEVIYDLREALYRYPVDVSIWQSLGDAYMRANRLQDALDAYTKAEELLR